MMKGLTVKRLNIGEIDEKFRVLIDTFNEDHGGTVFQETIFNIIAAETFETKLSYYLALLNGVIVGIFPCHQNPKGILLHSFSNLTSNDLPYGGWVYDSGKITIDQLIRQTKIRLNEALHISSSIELSEETPYKSAIVDYTTAHTVLLALRDQSADELFEGFSHAQRNKIRKAIKLGVEIEEITPDNIEVFYGLVEDLKNKVNKPIEQQDYYGRIFNRYYSQGRACCYVAKYEGIPVSTLMLLANNRYATIWMGGRKMDIPKNLYQNELMIWEAIKWGKNFGSAYFDLCVINEERYPNLARMKLSFSKDIRPYYFYNMRGSAFRLLNKLVRSASVFIR